MIRIGEEMNLVLRQSAGKAGIVCFLMCLGTLTSLHAQQEDSLYFSQPVMPVLYSPWAVTPFERQPHESYFSMDSVSSLRGVLKVRFESADKWTGFSSDGQTIFLYEAVYDRYFRLPFQAPLEWYVNEQLQRRRVKNFATVKKPGQEAGPTRVGEGVELVAVETSLGRATLTVNGNVNLTGKIVFQDQELTRSNFREAQTTHFEFDETQQIVVQGKVGDRVNVDLNYNSERDFDFENNIRINYSGTEDEIVQKIEAGNISLSLPSTQFVTFSGQSQGLFGVKSLMKLGPVDITTIASIERTKKQKQKITSGAESQGQNIPDYQYRKNQYFFVDRLFRDGGLVLDDDGAPIAGQTGILALSSFYPLKDGKHRIGNVVISEIEIFKSVGAAAGSGTIYGLAYVEPDYNEADNRWSEAQPQYSGDTEGSFFTRLIRNQDYIVSEDLGFIRLTMPVQNEILAVSFSLVERGDQEVIRTTGELSTSVAEGDTIHLKLIKPLTPNPGHPTWPLEFKNVYYLGASSITPEGFDVQITYKNGSLGNNERDQESGKTFINLFGLDSLDANANFTPDDLIDKMNPNIVNLNSGELIFPMLYPFEKDRTAGTEDFFGEGNRSEELSDILSDSAALYRSLSDQLIRNQSKFDIKVAYQNKSATINLGGFMLVEGSEEVYLNSVPLVKDKDYIIDYFTGSLTLLTEAYNEPGAELEVLFDKHELVSFDKKSIVGTRAQMDFGERSFIGATALYYDQSVINEKIEVGYEPTRNFIWGLNGRHSMELDGLSRAIDKLPLIETDKPSSFNFEGEFAQVLPNPNPVDNLALGDRDGIAFIDDFEGSKRTTNLGVRRRFWSRSSTPLDKNPKNRSEMFWYNPWTQVLTQDIWPNQQTSIRAQNQLTDVLVLNYTRRDAHRQTVNPDSNWASITASLYSSDFNQSQSKFFEVWLLTPDNTDATMTVDLGFISEDQNGNRVFDTEDRPEAGLLTGNTLLEDDEDIGLDGCTDPFENGYGGCLPDSLTYEQALNNPTLSDLVYIGTDLNTFDPNNDNWEFREEDSESAEKYRDINGTEGNGTADRPMEGARYPDTEDINRDGNFDAKDDYFSASFDLSPFSEDWERYQGGYNQTRMGKWRLYRIPLNEFKMLRENGNITWDTIKFVRLTLSGVNDQDMIQVAKVEIVGNEWQELGVRGSGVSTYAKDDSAFAVTVINTEDNADYARSVKEIGVQGEYDRLNAIRLKEQSLVLKFNELKPNYEGAAQKNIMELQGARAQSYLMYKKMRMFIYGNSDDIGAEDTDVDFFIRFGRANDYYEVRYPVYEGWDKQQKRNYLEIDLDFLTGLKRKDEDYRKFDDNDRFEITDSTRTYIATANSGRDTLHQYSIHGDPALSRIQYFVVGVKNKNRLKPVSGEVWIDELRFSRVRKDAGNAIRFQSQLALADVGNATVSYNRRNADFHVLQERLGSGNTNERFRADTRLQINKFLPQSWGLKIPFNVSFTENTTTPKYLPGTDVRIINETPPDSVLTKGRQFSYNTSFSKGSKSDKWLTRYTLDNLKFNYSAGRSINSNVQIAKRMNRNNAGGTSYILSFGRDNYFTPLRRLEKIPLFGKKLSETRLYYTPSSFDVTAKVSETLNESTPRVGDPKTVYNLGLDRNFRLGYKILENLTTNYTKAIKSDMDHFRNRYLEAVKEMKPGTVTDINESTTTTFTPTLAGWLRPNISYTSNYRWAKPLESTQEGATITSQGRFSTSLSLTPKTLVEVFYKPTSSARSGGGGGRRRGRSRTQQDQPEEKKEKKPMNPQIEKALKLLHKGASKINPISITYTQNRIENAFGVLGAAEIPYRLGLITEHGLDHSEEVGVNTGSRQWQRDFSVRSGLSLTRQITTSFNFAKNKAWGIDGNQVRTETQTRDFLPMGIMGNEGMPLAGWNVRLTGVEKWPLIKKVARSASLEHAFSGKESRAWQNNDLQTSKYTSSFSPLVGLSMSSKRGMTVSSRYSVVRTVDNRFGGINSTRVKADNTWTASTNYAYRGGLNIPLPFFRDFNFKNTINFTLTFDFSQSTTMERNDLKYDLSTTDQRESWKISPRVTYTFGKNVTGGIWYEYRESHSKIMGRKVDRDFGFDVNVPIRG